MDIHLRAIRYIRDTVLPPASFAFFVFSESVFLFALYRALVHH